MQTKAHSGCLLGTPLQYYKEHVREGLVVHVSVQSRSVKKKAMSSTRDGGLDHRCGAGEIYSTQRSAASPEGGGPSIQHRKIVPFRKVSIIWRIEQTNVLGQEEKRVENNS